MAIAYMIQSQDGTTSYFQISTTDIRRNANDATKLPYLELTDATIVAIIIKKINPIKYDTVPYQGMSTYSVTVLNLVVVVIDSSGFGEGVVIVVVAISL